MSTFGTKPPQYQHFFLGGVSLNTAGTVTLFQIKNASVSAFLKNASVLAFWYAETWNMRLLLHFGWKLLVVFVAFLRFFKLPGASWPWPGCSQQPSRSLQQLSWWHHLWGLPGTQAALCPGSLQKGCHHDNCCNGLEGCWLKPGQGQLEPGSLKKNPTKCSKSRIFQRSPFRIDETGILFVFGPWKC